MKKDFTKKDLHTGDIIENRGGERGVVILEKDCIIYQTGGLDIFEEIFTDDLFIDGTDRSGDIIKVYHDEEGPLGFNKLFGLEPVFVRRNDKRTRERAAELSDKHDRNKGKVTAVLLEPHFREYKKISVDPSMKDVIGEIDMVMSEAPSMTAVGQIQIDRTIVHVFDADNLFLIYNKYQEEWHLQVNRESKCLQEERPVFVIPETDIMIHSRCLIVRRDDSGNIVNLVKGDVEKVKKYMVGMNAKKE